MNSCPTDNKAPTSSVVERTVSDLIALAGGYKAYNQLLLSYFAPDLRRITKDVLRDPECDQECVLLVIARQCHRHATSKDGSLNCARYFGARVGSEPDQPLAREEYSPGCTNLASLLALDASPGARFPPIWAREPHRQRLEWMWVVLWTEILRNSPGPVLFDPLASTLFKSFDFHLDRIPRYLFRTFDPRSFGRSDEDVVASPASETGTLSSRIDILSQHESFAMSVVDRHMNPWRVKNYESQKPDNLMSWTSSLLYAIQYAFYRRHHHGCRSEDIKICIVDTEMFPRGQFIHAKRLLQAYYKYVKRADLRQFFDLRLLVYIYQNGEYLSQGTLNHNGRSRVVSLAELEKGGLYSLYPEFADCRRHAKWAVTTAYLRSLWGSQQVSTNTELEVALALARSCFAGFRVLDIAVIILCFKSRVLEWECGNEDSRGFLKGLPEWGRKPQEVQQYLVALQALDSHLRVAKEKSATTPGLYQPSDELDKQLIQALRGCFKVEPYEVQ